MFKQLLFAVLIMLPVCPIIASTAVQNPAAESEDTKTRLSKQEINDVLKQVGRMPSREQEAKLDLIVKNQADSKTPRSDFRFCMGMAYLGNYKAQKCVGNAYENGRGIVDDLSEAYTWYALAAEQNSAEAGADLERVKMRLVTAYPSPSEDELQDMVTAQKNRIKDYGEEAKKSGSSLEF